MSLKPLTDNIDDESFIILDSSPGTSLKSNGMNGALDKAQIEDAMKDLSIEASSSYHAHFNLAGAPSPASMMVASTMITEDKSTEELQKRFGEILDENVILKDTLKQNNDSLKEQFLLIASCHDDMLKTTMQHREKFEETKALIDRLRQENKKLKQDMAQLAESPPSLVNGETGELKKPDFPNSGPSSALEFVTSPEDDTVDKLTAQLELVEKQRRQVITDNEKLTWQKESLEHIVDATTKERDDLKERLKQVELSTKAMEHEKILREKNFTIEELQKKMEMMSPSSQQEIAERDTVIAQMNDRLAVYLDELKKTKIDLLKAENIKMEFADYKRNVNEMVMVHKNQIQEMHVRLKQATTTLFQPVRLSVSPVPSSPSDASSLASNVKLYDRALKHLAELLNKLTHGLSDSIVETLDVILGVYECRLERRSEAQIREGLDTVKQQLERQQCDALANIGQVRSTLTIFEDIFKDYKEELSKNSQEKPHDNISSLTAALVARGQELQALQVEVNQLRNSSDDAEHLKAQLEIYRSDFDAEREAREQMACERDILQTDLRQAQRRCEEVTLQLEEVRRINPAVHRSATSKPIQTSSAALHTASPATATSKIQSYRCPKCLTFTTNQYKVLEDHLDYCLDDF